MFHSLHPNLKIRITINFIQKLTQTAIFPFMTIYFAQQFGVTLAGVLILMTTVLSFIGSLYGGAWSDRYGRKRVLVSGEHLRLLSLVAMAFCNSAFLTAPTLTFVFFLMNNIVSGIVTPANEAILIDDSTTVNRKFLYALSYWTLNISIVVGSIAGGFLFQAHLFDLLVGAALASLVCLLLIRMRLNDTYRPQSGTSPLSWRGLYHGYAIVFRDRLFTAYLIAGVLTLSLELQLTHYLAVHFVDTFTTPQLLFGVPFEGTMLLGVLRSENTVLVLLFSFLVLKWTNPFNERSVLYTGVVLFSGGFAMLLVSDSIVIMLLGTFVFTLGELLYVPIHQALLARLMDESRRSQYLAVNGLRYRGALLIGAVSVSLYGWIPPFMMAVVYITFGATAIWLYQKVYRSLFIQSMESEQVG